MAQTKGTSYGNVRQNMVESFNGTDIKRNKSLGMLWTEDIRLGMSVGRALASDGGNGPDKFWKQ